ncbi:MAG: hypothetical protein JXB42_09775 [Deltaproteobacteria bacterium]|nr:hypothetical protein [Deltaproteobacteria bacterium]
MVLIVIFVLGMVLLDCLSVLVVSVLYGIFVFPGILLLRSMGISGLRSLFYGVPLGFSVTGLVLLVVIAVFGWNCLSITICYAALFVGVICVGMKGRIRRYAVIHPSESDSGNIDISFSLVLAIAVLSICVFIPLLRFGQLTEYGHAYSGLFGLDFLVRSVHAFSIAHSGLPPDNYYFAGTKITNYYFLWYLLPAMAYKILGTGSDIRAIVAVICLMTVPFFLFIFYDLLRNFLSRAMKVTLSEINAKKCSAVFFLVVFCSSYHWVFFILKKIVHYFGIPKLSQMAEQMNWLSQSWFRDFIFEPQVIIALMMAMLLYYFLSITPGLWRGVTIGTILSAIAVTDVWIFMVVCIAYFSYCVMRVIIEKQIIIVFDTLLTAITGLLFVGIFYAVGLFAFQESSNALVFKPNFTMILGLPVFLILIYGGAAVVGILGAMKSRHVMENQFLALTFLFSILFIVAVTEVMEGNVCLRKALYLARLPLSLWAGFMLYRVLISGKCIVITTVIMLVGLPTMATDIYAVAGTGNRNFTTYVSPAESAASEWIRFHTPVDSVVQSKVDYSGYYDYSLTIDFGERKAALGFYKMALLFHPQREDIVERLDKIKLMFRTEDDAERLQLLRELKINYVFIGKREEKTFPQCGKRFSERKEDYRLVYSNNEVMIFKVN